MATWIRDLFEHGARHKRAIYRCECGNEFVAETANVNRGHTKSCGCYRKAATAERSTTHGHKSGGKRTTTYVAWMNMKARCNNPKFKQYEDYGGRGITYDARWESFENFLADMGEAPPRMTIDREDNDGNYCKENCRWVNRAVQNNNKRNIKRYEFNGESLTLTEWSKKTGIQRVTLAKRIEAGIPLDQALTVKGFLGYRRNMKE